MYRIIIVLKNLVMEIKKIGKKQITIKQLKNTTSYQMADEVSKNIIDDITNNLKKETITMDKNLEKAKQKVYKNEAV